jgi:hypothetical protein
MIVWVLVAMICNRGESMNVKELYNWFWHWKRGERETNWSQGDRLVGGKEGADSDDKNP